MKAGQAIALALVATGVIGAFLAYWFAATFEPQPVEGVTEIEIGGESFAVSDYIGTDHPEAPVLLTGCFRLADPEGAIAAGVRTRVGGREPSLSTRHGDCKEPAVIRNDSARGASTAIVAETLTGEGADLERVVAVYPDGEAYQWIRVKEE